MLKSGGKIKRLQLAKCPELEQALYMWTMEAHAHKIAVNDSVLKENAIRFARIVNANINFSDGWLNNFKKRYNICSQVLHREAALVDTVSVEEACKELINITKDYALCYIYNADKTGLTYK